MTYADFLFSLAVVFIFGLFIGGCAVLYFLEHKHDCLPHHPDSCRYRKPNFM